MDSADLTDVLGQLLQWAQDNCIDLSGSNVGYLPAQPIVDGDSRALEATSHGAAMATPRDLAVLLAWTGAGLLLSQRWFAWEPRFGKSRRT